MGMFRRDPIEVLATVVDTERVDEAIARIELAIDKLRGAENRLNASVAKAKEVTRELHTAADLARSESKRSGRSRSW